MDLHRRMTTFVNFLKSSQVENHNKSILDAVRASNEIRSSYENVFRYVCIRCMGVRHIAPWPPVDSIMRLINGSPGRQTSILSIRAILLDYYYLRREPRVRAQDILDIEYAECQRVGHVLSQLFPVQSNASRISIDDEHIAIGRGATAALEQLSEGAAVYDIYDCQYAAWDSGLKLSLPTIEVGLRLWNQSNR